MATSNSSTDRQTPPLWSFVRLNEFAAPAEPATETVNKGLRGLLARLRPQSDNTELLVRQKELHAIPQVELERWVAVPDWSEPALALDHTLADWLDTAQPDAPIQLMVGAPYSATATIINHWALAHAWPVLTAPSPHQILAGDETWLSRLDATPATALVIPHLEHFFLRHYDGLELIRRLLDLLWTGQRRSLICCDSWAWAYLCSTLQIDALLPRPFTPAAFDRHRLRRWFQSLVTQPGRYGVTFRQANNGNCVLPPINAGATPNQPESETKVILTDFLDHLAAYARGNSGVARAIWRDSLKVAPDEDVREKAEALASSDQGQTIWVTPWSELKLPGVPDANNPAQLFVLHTLLLHNGLPLDLLVRLLPLSQAEVTHGVHRLQAAGLLVLENDRWRITARAYPALRRFLNSHGYLVDDL